MGIDVHHVLRNDERVVVLGIVIRYEVLFALSVDVQHVLRNGTSSDATTYEETPCCVRQT